MRITVFVREFAVDTCKSCCLGLSWLVRCPNVTVDVGSAAEPDIDIDSLMQDFDLEEFPLPEKYTYPCGQTCKFPSKYSRYGE